MSKFVEIFLIIVSILLLSFLVWAGYYSYSYLQNAKNVENTLFTISPDSSSSIEYSSSITVYDAMLVDKGSEIEIVNSNVIENKIQKLYSIPKTTKMLGDIIYGKVCSNVKIIEIFSNRGVLIFESTGCDQ